MKHTEKTIQDNLFSHYSQNSKFRIPNIYLFMWESDFFVTKDNGYCYEFEIKISRSDFKNEKKKVDKHSILKTGSYIYQKKEYMYDGNKFKRDENNQIMFDIIPETITQKRPNKFFYIVPEGLIGAHEIPSYSGLMYVNDSGDIRTIREAPFLHKEKINFDKELCMKFYHYWMNERYKRIILEREKQSNYENHI